MLLSLASGMLSIGDRVRLAGLVAKPELNGREGIVVSLGERIGVKLDGAEKALAIQPQNLEIEVVTERGVRLRTHEGLDGAIGSLIYLSDAAPIACENCGAVLPPGPSDVCGRCGRDHRYSGGHWERSEAAQAEYEEAMGRTLWSDGARVRDESEVRWPTAEERERGAPTWWSEEAGWKERHAPRAPDCGASGALSEAAAPETAPVVPSISWGKAGDNEWQMVDCPQCAPLPCQSTAHFKSDEEREWWVNMLSGRAARRGGGS